MAFAGRTIAIEWALHLRRTPYQPRCSAEYREVERRHHGAARVTCL